MNKRFLLGLLLFSACAWTVIAQAGVADRAALRAARRAARAAAAAAATPAVDPEAAADSPASVPQRVRRAARIAAQPAAAAYADAPTSSALAALRKGIEDLVQNYPGQYTKGAQYLARLDALTQALAAAPNAPKLAQDFRALRYEALMANPLLDFNKLLLVKRNVRQLGLPNNWLGNCALPRAGFDNEIATLDLKNPAAGPQTLFKPDRPVFVGDVDLHFDADRMLFSMVNDKGTWQIFEIKADGTGLRQVTEGAEPDVDNYDACYLPSGRIIFDSTRNFAGVPCIGGKQKVANLCSMDADGKNTRMLCFEQDHDWCPTVMNNGRILYTRWEYSDTAHYFTRILMMMNPDGTGQGEYSGSNSYWPNSTFYTRPIPGSPTKAVGIISGHHGAARMGEMIIFDSAKGRREGDVAVQRIASNGKPLTAPIMDQLVRDSWPKFLHPYPLSDKYFLVSCQPAQGQPWGIYLVDVFDNIVPLATLRGYALFEPLPFRKTPTPPVIPDKVDLKEKEASIYIQDIYRGPGLKNVPRGTVKNLRLYTFHFAYPKMGGHRSIGVEGPWDVHRIIGTVPVEPDGSAAFKVPANTPISMQPLDENGRALQLMRSWFTAMPGEKLSCVGCHEQESMAPPVQLAAALRKAPASIQPWHGPERGFDFKREIQPVLDRACVGCHNGTPGPEGQGIPDFSAKARNGWGNFTPSYLALHPYVRRPGPESDYHILAPLDFSATTSELIQMLEKGHHNVNLEPEEWDRLYTWIDLNVPDKGTWSQVGPIPEDYHQRRIDMMTKYANRPGDPEAVPELAKKQVVTTMPENSVPVREVSVSNPAGWPLTAAQAAALQAASGETQRTVDLGGGVSMEMVLIPAGEFVMGSSAETADERPLSRVKIDAPFWMGTTEVSNAQYQRFDPAHDSRFIDQEHKDHTTPGYPANEPAQPVIRVNWNEAMAFCAWLSAKNSQPFSLPSEAQWEWACRAGSETPFAYGGFDADFSSFANLADQSISLLAVSGVNPQPIRNPIPFVDFLPKDARFNDGNKIECAIGSYKPNAWGLYDMHGNVAEWTRSLFKPYPYASADGREDSKGIGKRVVRGGSWMDRPYRATASFRLAYESWQPVYNVGFRVVCPAEVPAKVAMK